STAGTYNVTLTSSTGCDSTATLVLTVTQSLPGQRYSTVVTGVNVPVQLTARNLGAGHSYEWNPKFGLNDYASANPTFSYDRDMEYTIEIIPTTGCAIVDTVLVRVLDNIPPDESGIFVPKAWTPNGDGHNDKLFPIPVNIKELKYFRVFNRWGQMVFETNVLREGWDGIFKGQPQVSDTYTWTLEATGNDGKYYKRSGNSILLR
ncbi:MAG TPA: gliding motility-associated C-terminal domain-containing protein, partial [Chitinophagaceae bacterium]|nr:gliding motility-associated C-terminal domain-containing protein [Chitinophagaceae bacterium]